MHGIRVSAVQREGETYHSADVNVDGVTVATLIKDPTAECPEWFTHDAAVRIPSGEIVEIPDQEWGSTIREARKMIAAYIRGYLK